MCYRFSVEQKKETQGLLFLLSEEGGRYMASEKQVRSSFSSSVLNKHKSHTRFELQVFHCLSCVFTSRMRHFTVALFAHLCVEKPNSSISITCLHRLTSPFPVNEYVHTQQILSYHMEIRI